jgi:phosphoglycolate phosphatase
MMDYKTTETTMLKLIIFDFDGTLVDTIEDITVALNYACAPLSITFTVEKTRRLVGSGVSRLIEKATAEAGSKSFKFDVILNRFLDFYSEHLIVKSKPYDGVVETLKSLDSDYKKALVSNKKESLTVQMLREFGMDRFFDCVLGGDSLPEKKPSALPVLEVLKRLDLHKNEAVIVGDGDQDIQAGKAAGIVTIAAAYGYRDREELAGADYIIDNIRQLIPLVKTL